MGKYCFRKMYFICRDNKVIDDNVGSVVVFKKERDAEVICQQDQRRLMGEAGMVWHPKGYKPPVLKVHGFYLVHESLYEEILNKFDKLK